MRKLAVVLLVAVALGTACQRAKPVYTMPPTPWEVCSMPDGWMVGRLVNHDPPSTFASSQLRDDFAATDKALAARGNWIPLLAQMRRDCQREFPIPTFTVTST
jgi:hypothetical protein